MKGLELPEITRVEKFHGAGQRQIRLSDFQFWR